MNEDHAKFPEKVENSHGLATEVIQEEVKKKGFALLIHDFKQRKLIPVKLLSLLVFSGYGVLLPFFAIHMKSLGISVEETGAIYGVSCIISVLTPLCTGMMADKLGNFKVLLSLSFGLASISALLFLLIPVGRMAVDYPVNSSFIVGCEVASNLTDHSSPVSIFRSLDMKECDFKVKQGMENDVANISVVLNECGYMCYHSNEFYDEYYSEVDVLSEVQSVGNFTQAFREATFFPDDWILNAWCLQTTSSEGCREENRERGTSLNATLVLDWSSNTANKSTKFPIKWITLEDNGETSSERFLNTKRLCNPHDEDEKFHRTAYVKYLNESEKSYQFCRPQCTVRISRSELCSNTAQEKVFNPQLTFWLYMLFRCIFDVFVVGSATLFEGAVLAMVYEVRGDYGFQKMFGLIGIAIFSPISGALIDHASLDENNQNFRPAYFLFAGLFGVAAMGTLTIDLKFKPPAENVVKDVKSLLKNIELDALLVIALVLGLLVGCTGNYVFLFLEEIGVNKSLMGLSVMISCITAIPLLLFSETIFRKLGYPNVIVVCFSGFIVRLIGYSYISMPSLCLVYESIEAVTGTLAMTTLMIYGARLGTTSTVASIQGLISATYFGLGAGIGSSVGGFLIGAYSQRTTFRILGVIAFIAGFFYFLFNVFFLRRRNANIIDNGSAAAN
ncbi:hypothetical protein GHT06_010216 [Daphnia sinensis]|uniref:Major facilitator superfamily associated domain-containing protein n=1 Tax=Daphnia sinensis TaxID=1820382 RepID=A0AAD5L0N3_9CRUS|nr:hypothetical protein GHT06_010216 [Daphnia sinensis]